MLARVTSIRETFTRVFFSATAISLLISPSAFSWGGHAHSLVNEYAVNNLPSKMVYDGSGNSFGDMRAYLGDHSSDPDWQKDYDGDESCRHWCDIDLKIETYPPPFDTVPRDYYSYLSIFGRENGVVQWEGIRDHYDSLVELMKVRDWQAAYQRAAELGHYVADATCPLHCIVNYDGQLSRDPRNTGIHRRYESYMVQRFIKAINTKGSSATYVRDRVKMGFALLSSGWEFVDEIMAADSEAQDIVGDGNFDEQYYQELFTRVGEGAQIRLDLAARTVADLWYSAWVDAGCPSFVPTAEGVNNKPAGSSSPLGYGVGGDLGWVTYGWR